MNILILNWRDVKNPKSGGAEIVTLEHAKGWVKSGHKVLWFTSRFKGSKKNELIDGVEIIRAGNFLTVYLIAPLFYLFSGRKIDLVVDEIHGLPFFTPIYVRKPIIAFIHEVAEEIWDYMYPFPINKIGKIVEPILLLPYRRIKFITVSDSTKKSLIKIGVLENNIVVINNGIKEEILKKLPEKEKNPTFIFVSRVVRMKGIEEVIKAFSFIAREYKKAKLWIVGSGDREYIEKLKKMINEYGIIDSTIFFGRVSEDKKLALIRKAHILLHASVKEGWGLVVIEAASQSTPSVVYNVSGLKDSVRNDKTGKIIRENSPYEMAKEALSLLQDRRKYIEYQNNCLKWAKQFTWAKSIKKSTQIIEDIVVKK